MKNNEKPKYIAITVNLTMENVEKITAVASENCSSFSAAVRKIIERF